jgi:V/A-type H+-transporting ATPase subunit E
VSETAKFTVDILTAANEKAQSIISQAETETQQALKDAKADMMREADDIVRNAHVEAEGVKRRQISEVRHRIKLQEQQEKNKILTDVLETTRKRIIDVTNNESKYFPYLTGMIESGIREIGINNVVVQLNAKDLKRVDKGILERELAKKVDRSVKVEWANEPIDALGGAVLSSKDGKTRIPNTLDQRFEALEPKLLIEAGKVLFGN